MDQGRQTVRINAASLAWRRFYAVYLPLFGVGLVWAIYWGEAGILMIVIFVTLFVTQVAMGLVKSGHVELSGAGLKINTVVRSRTIPWPDVTAIELAKAGRPARILLADGDAIRSEALARFVAPPPRGPGRHGVSGARGHDARLRAESLSPRASNTSRYDPSTRP